MSDRKTGFNNDVMQKNNRALVLRLLQKEGECSRVRLAQLAGLKQATITNIINEFIQMGLVRENGFLTGEKGRRSIGVALDGSRYRVLGVRLTRRKISVAAFDMAGQMLGNREADVEEDSSPDEDMEKLLAMLSELIQQYGAGNVLAVGVALPGPFLPTEKRILLMTGKSPKWKNIHVDQVIQDHFHIPAFLEHDANAGALCQLWNDPDVAYGSSVLYVAAGQGIGAGIVIDGTLYRGPLGTAGELGHLSIDWNGVPCECGSRGCLERYSSSIALSNAVNVRLSPDSALTFSEIAELVRQGDSLCINEYRRACKLLGIGLVSVINLLDPETIILGDEMTWIAPQIMVEEVSHAVQERVLPELYKSISIRAIRTIMDSVLCGAGIVALQKVFLSPDQFLGLI